MYGGNAPPTGTVPTGTPQLPAREFYYSYDSIGNRLSVGDNSNIANNNQYSPIAANELQTRSRNNTVRVLGNGPMGISPRQAAKRLSAKLIAIMVPT